MLNRPTIPSPEYSVRPPAYQRPGTWRQSITDETKDMARLRPQTLALGMLSVPDMGIPPGMPGGQYAQWRYGQRQGGGRQNRLL